MDAFEPMPCRDFVELVTDYLEGTLPARERRRFEAHLALCDPCVTYLEQMRETIAVIGRTPSTDLSASLREGLIEAFRSWQTA